MFGRTKSLGTLIALATLAAPSAFAEPSIYACSGEQYGEDFGGYWQDLISFELEIDPVAMVSGCKVCDIPSGTPIAGTNQHGAFILQENKGALATFNPHTRSLGYSFEDEEVIYSIDATCSLTK